MDVKLLREYKFMDTPEFAQNHQKDDKPSRDIINWIFNMFKHPDD